VSALRKVLATAVVITAVALSGAMVIPEGASAAPTASVAPTTDILTLIKRQHSTMYPALYWDHCTNGPDDWIYLEAEYSSCGSSPGGTWSFSYVSARYAIDLGVWQRNLEVCHSNDHSGVTKLLDSDQIPPTHSLSDSAGGGCATATRIDLLSWWATWGGDNSMRISPMF
jgi:hypothetical protein